MLMIKFKFWVIACGPSEVDVKKKIFCNYLNDILFFGRGEGELQNSVVRLE